MVFLKTSTIFSVLVGETHAYLKQNAVCGSNKQCEPTCLRGEYYVSFDGRSSFFECTYSKDDCKVWYYRKASDIHRGNYDKTDDIENNASQTSLCETSCGRACTRRPLTFCLLLESAAGAYAAQYGPFGDSDQPQSHMVQKPYKRLLDSHDGRIVKVLLKITSRRKGGIAGDIDRPNYPHYLHKRLCNVLPGPMESSMNHLYCQSNTILASKDVLGK
jgi:hypothetical protein